jgi:hypothetical protein
MLGWPRWRKVSAHSAESYARSVRDRETNGWRPSWCTNPGRHLRLPDSSVTRRPRSTNVSPRGGAARIEHKVTFGDSSL